MLRDLDNYWRRVISLSLVTCGGEKTGDESECCCGYPSAPPVLFYLAESAIQGVQRIVAGHVITHFDLTYYHHSTVPAAQPACKIRQAAVMSGIACPDRPSES